MNSSSNNRPPPSARRSRGDSSPWYRQFWPWFLIALPASSVAFSFATLFIALNDPDTVLPHEGEYSSFAAPHATDPSTNNSEDTDLEPERASQQAASGEGADRKEQTDQEQEEEALGQP